MRNAPRYFAVICCRAASPSSVWFRRQLRRSARRDALHVANPALTSDGTLPQLIQITHRSMTKADNQATSAAMHLPRSLRHAGAMSASRPWTSPPKLSATTSSPCRANGRACSRPSPRPALVTMPMRPSNRFTTSAPAKKFSLSHSVVQIGTGGSPSRSQQAKRARLPILDFLRRYW